MHQDSIPQVPQKWVQLQEQSFAFSPERRAAGLPSIKGLAFTAVTVVTMVPQGITVRSRSTFATGSLAGTCKDLGSEGSMYKNQEETVYDLKMQVSTFAWFSEHYLHSLYYKTKAGIVRAVVRWEHIHPEFQYTVPLTFSKIMCARVFFVALKILF